MTSKQDKLDANNASLADPFADIGGLLETLESTIQGIAEFTERLRAEAAKQQEVQR